MGVPASPVRHLVVAPTLECPADAVDVSAVLRCGVYALVRHNTVIYVGQSKMMLQRIVVHRRKSNRNDAGVPTWLPIKNFVFDRVFVWPCRLEELDELEQKMIKHYRPRFNTTHNVVKGQKLPWRAALMAPKRPLLGIERRI